ncbi:LamG-like jellyroll fold domain-containing protein [uncultured Nonlabens sp.]|uniref:LamG-like jellyroll fold domain-containing protein n=1 Tax=uncultured Nonlabens sp. TaxID=859306 RepID=UPI0026276377|nr:LamG-like jellyroll fold domain-containing protein [uncultured Nonlabens sp.]
MKTFYANKSYLRIVTLVTFFTLSFFSSQTLWSQTPCSSPVTSDRGNELYIDDYRFASISNLGSGFDASRNTVQDFRGVHTTNVTRGDQYTHQITLGGDRRRIDAGQYSLFIDYNDDGFTPEDNIYFSGRVEGGTLTLNYTIPVDAPLGTHEMWIRGRAGFLDANPCRGRNRSELERYTITVVDSPIPVALDDDFTAIFNSTNADNSFDVSTNDTVGTTNGTDGDDYSIVSSPLRTANGGTVVETAVDGVFEYTPLTDYIGSDSFEYTLCDRAGVCEVATVHISINYGACVPVSDSQGSHYITNVTLTGESTSINNTTGDDDGYGDYVGLPPADVYPGETYVISGSSQGDRPRWGVFIDFNKDGVFADDEIVVQTTVDGALNGMITIPAGSALGPVVMRVVKRTRSTVADACGATSRAEETEDYLIDIVTDPSSPQEINVSGGVSNITHNSMTPSSNNRTDFGAVDKNAGALENTFYIQNTGAADLILGPIPVDFIPGHNVAWSIVSSPPAGTVITSGNSVSFTVRFEPRRIGNLTATVRVYSNDDDENPFRFLVSGEGAEIFPDTDGDGVVDNIDIDDDNDGVPDEEEQNNCLANPLSTTADIVFLNETFGSGISRTRIDDVIPGVSTTYCYEDGTPAQATDECNTDINLRDGKYTVHYSVTDDNGVTETGSNLPDVSFWAENVWYNGDDHTPGDVNGRMALFNASFEPAVFYETEIVGTVPGAPIYYEFWALNLDRQDSVFPSSQLPRILPNVTVNFYSTDKTILYHTYQAGDIPRCNTGTGCSQSQWINKNTSITLPTSDFVIQLLNNAPGGFGNDVALDDILITQQLCDLDSDGVSDVIDLDNDNDGIPNIYELGIPAGLVNFDSNLDGTNFGDGNWVDANENGMHDLYEGYSPLDTDNDGVADYLDLDSDNDGLFDVLEYDGKGDADINGDGRSNASDGVTNFADDEFDGDGLVGFIDENDSDGNKLDHGTFNYVAPVDTDGDGIADYRDVDSNDALNDLSNGSDIDNSYYAHLDSDNDGQVDFLIDVDKDGVSDGNNDLDTGILGAPIDLDTDLYVDFDGRNDYIVNSTEVLAGLNNFTVFAWIMLDAGASSTGAVFSERGMILRVEPSGDLRLTVRNSSGNVYNLSSSSSVTPGKWFNLSVRYDGANGVCALYVNGVEVASSPIANNTAATIAGNKFTIGRGHAEGSTNYFHGAIDEVRVFNKAINIGALERMMYQEIGLDGGELKGKVITRSFTDVDWADLLLHYDFKKVTGDKLFDVSSKANNATMFNIKTILPQSAPLPYETKQDGLMSDPTTYLQEVVWDPIDLAVYPFSIIHIKHQNVLPITAQSSGLLIDSGAKLTILDGNVGNNKWYMKLDGVIDLLGDAQLVQTADSELDVASTGKIIRRQEGKGDVFSYNYWSSPVGVQTSASNNNTFNLGMLKDGRGTGNIQFTGIGVRTPAITSPATVSGRWLHTFMNGVSYNDWNRIGPADLLEPGHGWTQKGAGAVGDQEYIFEGKPNNGVINITAIDTDGDPALETTTSLVGNPYPSAIDARVFIDDNASVTDGAVYLWDQFRGTDHILANYEGGYATITKLATTRASQIAGSGALGGPSTGTVEPTFFIPVAQGFFVSVVNSGTLTFNNSQRIFKTESAGESVFVSAPGATQPVVDRSDYQNTDVELIRLELEADNGASKEIVLGFSDTLTDGVDFGYDGPMFDSPRESDLYTSHEGKNYVIRALSEIEPSKVVPLTIHGMKTVNYKISAKEIANINSSQELFLRDKDLNIYHDLRSGDYFFNVSEEGKNSSRFEIVFQQSTLGVDQETLDEIDIYYLNNTGMIYVDHLSETLETMDIYDISGKLLFRFRESELTDIVNGVSIPEISTGVYLVKIESQGFTKAVKIAVK